MSEDRSAWLAWRRSGIGASDVAGIMGLSPWASPYSVWLSKVTDVADTGDSEAMEFGRRAEPMLGLWFESRHPDLYVRGEQTWCTHRSVPWAICTVDGFIFDTPDPAELDAYIAVAEWKTTSSSPADWADKIPDHYACQAAWTMAVCDTDVVHFGVLHLAFGRPAFRTYEFHRDAGDEQAVMTACEAFWRDHVLTGEPPSIDAHPATTDALKGQWDGEGGIVEADAAAVGLVTEYCYHRAQAKAAEADMEAAANGLRLVLGDDVELVDGKRRLASWRPSQRTTVDTTALRKAWPDLVRDFERTTTTRTLRVTETKG